MVAANRPRSDDSVRRFGHGTGLSSYSSPYTETVTPDPSTTRGPQRSPNLPSVPSATPLATVVDKTPSVSNNKYIVSNNHQPPPKRRRIGGHVLGDRNGSDELSSERDMEQLFEMYVPSSPRDTC